MARKAGTGSRQPAPRRLYPIQDHGYDFRTGSVGDGREVIMGLLCLYLVAFFFDPKGNYLETQKRVLHFMKRHQPPYDIYDKRIEERLHVWQEEIGLRPKTIKVKRFMSADGAGIEDLPGHYQQFLEDPSQFDEEGRQYYPELIRDWREEGSFVFWWAKDYWMSRNGEVEST